jgi:hypothetical protein
MSNIAQKVNDDNNLNPERVYFTSKKEVFIIIYIMASLNIITQLHIFSLRLMPYQSNFFL